MGDERKASDLNVITSDLTKLSLQNDLSILPEEEFVIEIQGQTLKCCRELLKRNSKFFEGFFNFEPNKKRIHIEGGLDFDSCEKLVQFWQTAQLDVSGSTVQELLLGKFTDWIAENDSEPFLRFRIRKVMRNQRIRTRNTTYQDKTHVLQTYHSQVEQIKFP